jgi:hypothetical protein
VTRPDAVGKRGYEAMERGFHDEGIMFRIVGDSIAVTPPLIVGESQIGEIFDKTAKVIKARELISPAGGRAPPRGDRAALNFQRVMMGEG